MTTGTRHIVLGALVLCATGAWSAAPACAQSCAMLPPGTPPEGPAAGETTVNAVVQAVAGALTREGVTVLPTLDAQRRMVGEPFAACNALDCGANVVRSLGVDFVVLVTVWAPRGAPSSVVITFIDADDSVAGDAPVEADDPIAAAMSALRVARQLWQAAQMGFIEVSSDPTGAHVEVDGRIVGETPLRHLVMSGHRTVRVFADGYHPATEMVVVEPTREHTIAVTLAVDEAGAREAGDVAPVARGDEAHWASFLVGGGLVAAGLGLLVAPIHGFAVDGACVGPDPCGMVHQFGTANGVLFGLGIAAIAGGVVFMIAAPLRLSVAASRGSATVALSGTFR